MKTTVKKISLYCCALIILTSVAISCQKETVKSETSDIQTLSLQKENGEITSLALAGLVRKMNIKSTEKEFMPAVNAFRSLSATDLTRYYEIRKEIEIQRAADSAKPGDNVELLKLEAAASADLRIEVNAAAIEKYKQGLNKLDPKLFDGLTAKIYALPKYSILRHTGANVNAKDVTISSCTIGYYPGTVTTNSGWGSGLNWYGCYYMSNNGDGSDCDYEFRYDGTYWLVRANSGDTYLMLVTPQPAGFGDYMSRRTLIYSDGNDTGVLLGATRVHIWVGQYYYVYMGAI